MKSAPFSRFGPGLVRTLILSAALLALLAPTAFAGDGYLGVQIQSLDETLAAALDLEDDAGVLVSDVVGDSPAADAGLQRGDLILTINGREAVDAERFTRRVRHIDAGETATLEILRKGKPMKITVTLADAPERESFWRTAPRDDDLMFFGDDDYVVGSGAPEILIERLGSGAYLGVNTHGLDNGLGSYFGTETGALVLSVREDSAAEEGGLRSGDVILAVGDEDVSNTIELQEAIQDLEPGDDVAIRIMRDKKEQVVDVELGESPDLHFARQWRGPKAPGLHHRRIHVRTAPDYPTNIRVYDRQDEDFGQELQELRERLQELEKQLEEGNGEK